MDFKNVTTVLLLFLGLCGLQSQAQRSPNEISGRVTHVQNPLPDVNIVIVGTTEGTFTDADGYYRITAYPGQILKYSTQGLKSVEIVVEDVTDFLNVNMVQEAVALDEVIVEKKKGGKQERMRLDFGVNKKIYRTFFGYVNLDEMAFGAQIIDGDKLNPAAVDFLSAVQGRISGARTVYRNGVKSLSIRGAGVVYDVDGLINLSPPDFLVAQDIDRIVVLKSRASTMRYGMYAGATVIVVNTRSGNYVPEPGTNEPYDRARLRYNNYKGDAITLDNRSQGLPGYLQELHGSSTMALSKKIYSKHFDFYKAVPYFFIDSYSFFASRGERKFASRILKDGKTILTGNPVFAKALAYHFEANGQIKLANDQYEEIFKMRPSYGQSYHDLAESYRDLGETKKAASIYMRYNYLIKEGLSTGDSIFQPLIEKEFDNLLSLKGGAFFEDSNKIVPVNNPDDFIGTRLLFSWSDSEAEFDLQFVNPDKKYYSWKHSLSSDSDRIKNEKLIGYSCEEFLIDGTLEGKWLINVNYKGNKRLTPTYLKVDIYFDYGTPRQRKQVKVFRLGIKNVQQELFELVDNNIRASYKS